MGEEAVSIRNRSPSSDQPGLDALSIVRFFVGNGPDSDATVPPAEDALHRVPLDHAATLPRLGALPARDDVHDPGPAHSRLLDPPAPALTTVVAIQGVGPRAPRREGAPSAS